MVSSRPAARSRMSRSSASGVSPASPGGLPEEDTMRMIWRWRADLTPPRASSAEAFDGRDAPERNARDLQKRSAIDRVHPNPSDPATNRVQVGIHRRGAVG